MRRSAIYIVLALCLLCASRAYKILIIVPVTARSHFILGNEIVKHLIEAGHEITYITAVIPEKTHPNITVIDVTDNEKVFGREGVVNIRSAMETKDKYDFYHFIPNLMEVSKRTAANENVQKLLSDKTQYFDACIVDWVYNEALAGFAGVFDCPLIWLSPVEPNWMILEIMDEVPNPAYNVDIMSNGVPPLTFVQRVWELYLQLYGTAVRKFYVNRIQDEIYKDYFVPHIRSRPVPSFESLMYNGSLVLSNSHVSMGIPTRLPPNFIPIGGYHIDAKIKPLPKKLQRIMDIAKHGVIYFSMGTNLRSKHFPDEVKRDLLKTFSDLNQTVIWKFEEELSNSPSNVHVMKWAPQQSILAHKNCILFITHGGLLSTTETIHFGVPIIGIPVFADQFVNVERSERKGFAIKVELSYSLANDLKVAIQEMLSNKRYTTKIKELSKIYHDRPVNPKQELVHWVEHVIKMGGGLHLRSPAILMPWYQKFYLDLIIVLLVITIIIKFSVSFTFRLFKSKLITSIKKKIN